MIKSSTALKDVNTETANVEVPLSPGRPTHDLNLWHALMELSKKRSEFDAPLLSSTEHTIPASSNICHPSTWYDVVPVICSGWAMSSIMLPDDRQQILSFLLPGDIASTALVFGPTSGRQVRAVNKVTYRAFNRSELKIALSKNPELLDKLLKVWFAEQAESDQLAIDLGRRTADERLARLILKLMNRLAQRGMVQDHTIDFPLRQHQIADATGLTPVHVSRVLNKFRRKGLVEIEGRSLTIRNGEGLSHIARSMNRLSSRSSSRIRQSTDSM